MNDFIPKNILELAKKYGAKIDVTEAPNNSGHYKDTYDATVALTRNDATVKLHLLCNEKGMKSYMCNQVEYGKWWYNEDDYAGDEILKVVEGIFENRTAIRRPPLSFRKVLCITDKDGQPKYWPRT